MPLACILGESRASRNRVHCSEEIGRWETKGSQSHILFFFCPSLLSPHKNRFHQHRIIFFSPPFLLKSPHIRISTLSSISPSFIFFPPLFFPLIPHFLPSPSGLLHSTWYWQCGVFFPRFNFNQPNLTFANIYIYGICISITTITAFPFLFSFSLRIFPGVLIFFFFLPPSLTLLQRAGSKTYFTLFSPLLSVLPCFPR